jgi:hypothetical protein
MVGWQRELKGVRAGVSWERGTSGFFPSPKSSMSQIHREQEFEDSLIQPEKVPRPREGRDEEISSRRFSGLAP